MTVRRPGATRPKPIRKLPGKSKDPGAVFVYFTIAIATPIVAALLMIAFWLKTGRTPL